MMKCFSILMTKLHSRLKHGTVWENFEYLQEFCRETTLHGLIHLVVPKRHWLERVMWILALIVSVIGSCWIVTESWNRYSTSPIVVSMVKEFRTWDITLATCTVCFNDKLDLPKAEQFIKTKWNISVGEEKYDYYLSFVRTVANSGLNTLDPFETFADDASLSDVDLLDTALNTAAIHSNIYNVLSADTPISWTVTEMGVCFSGMSPNSIAYKLNLNFQPKIESKRMEHMPFCKSTKMSCLGSIMHFDRSYVAYTHSPLEIPDISKKPIAGDVKQRITAFVEEDYLYSSQSIHNLGPKQRKCYFPDETIYGSIPVYSINLCRMQCRRNNIYKHCGCVPHFYNPMHGQRVCDPKGLACVAKIVDQVIHDTVVGKSKTCVCFPACEEIIYRYSNIQKHGFRGSVFGWNIINFTKTRYRRDIIFEFSDLLVSFGGTAALFLGCSLLSGVELIYFFTVRLTRFIGRKTVYIRQTLLKRKGSFWNRVHYAR